MHNFKMLAADLAPLLKTSRRVVTLMTVVTVLATN
jgi:hypothetical protein